MNKERLLKLADFLETVPEWQFDLASWRHNPEAVVVSAVTDAELKHGCGTTGCAVGWACAMPEFQAEGLSFVGNNPMLQPEHYGEAPYRGWAAVQVFFDIDYEGAEYLFCSFEYWDGAGPSDVAARIRSVVRGGR